LSTVVDSSVLVANRGVRVHIMARPPHKLKKEKLVETVGGLHQDWENSHPLDLSDEGLLADLEKHGAEGADTLAIGGDHDRKKHSKH
jgi:cardiolipin synthase A/B